MPNHTSIVQLVHSFSLTAFLSHFLAVSCSINSYCLQLNLKCLFSVFKKKSQPSKRESAIAQSLFFKLRCVCVSWPFASYIYKRRLRRLLHFSTVSASHCLPHCFLFPERYTLGERQQTPASMPAPLLETGKEDGMKRKKERKSQQNELVSLTEQQRDKDDESESESEGVSECVCQTGKLSSGRSVGWSIGRSDTVCLAVTTYHQHHHHYPDHRHQTSLECTGAQCLCCLTRSPPLPPLPPSSTTSPLFTCLWLTAAQIFCRFILRLVI